MTVQAVDLDLGTLLAPLSPEQPAGVDLRNSAEFKTLFAAAKDAFDNASHAEEEAERAKDPLLEPHEREYLVEHLQVPDWDAVRAHAADILAHRSKDLRVAAWLVEALVRTSGADGLLFGVRLLHQLCQAFWDQIHERPDASGLTTTVAPIAKLGRRFFLSAIRSLPMVESTSAGPISVRDYRAAQNLESLADPEERQRQIEQGVLPLAELEAAARAVPAAEWSQVRETIEAAAAELDQLQRWLRERCDNAAPSLSGVAEAIHECLEIIVLLAPVQSPDVPALHAGTEPVTGTQTSVSGAVTNRREAFEALRRVAQFFRDTEPQSPLCWQLERVVRLGQLNFPELLAEVVRDEDTRAALAREIGTDIPTPGN